MKKLLLIIVAFLIAGIGFTDDMPSEVKRLKEQRDRKVAEKTKEIDTVYYRELDRLKKKYAAQKNYTAAAYVEKMQIAIIDSNSTKMKGGMEATTVGAEREYADIYCKSGFVQFKTKSNICNSSRLPNSHYSFVPEEFEMFKISVCEYPAEGDLKFKVKTEGMVRLVERHKPSVDKLVKQEWKKVGTAKYSNERDQVSELVILEKFLEKGEYNIPHEVTFGIRILKK